MNALLQSLGDGKVARFDGDSVISLRRVLGHEKQVGYFLVDEIVVTLDVFFIYIQLGRGAKKTLGSGACL